MDDRDVYDDDVLAAVRDTEREIFSGNFWMSLAPKKDGTEMS